MGGGLEVWGKGWWAFLPRFQGDVQEEQFMIPTLAELFSPKLCA